MNVCKNIRIQWQKNRVNSKKKRYDQRYFGRDSVKCAWFHAILWNYDKYSVNWGDSMIC